MATILDTHKTVRRLREAGFDETQAETLTDILRETGEGFRQDFVTRPDLSHFATKADLADLATKADLAPLASKADLAQLAAELRVEIGAVETRILKWLVPLLLGQVALIVGLLRLL